MKEAAAACATPEAVPSPQIIKVLQLDTALIAFSNCPLSITMTVLAIAF